MTSETLPSRVYDVLLRVFIHPEVGILPLMASALILPVRVGQPPLCCLSVGFDKSIIGGVYLEDNALGIEAPAF